MAHAGKPSCTTVIRVLLVSAFPGHHATLRDLSTVYRLDLTCPASPCEYQEAICNSRTYDIVVADHATAVAWERDVLSEASERWPASDRILVCGAHCHAKARCGWVISGAYSTPSAACCCSTDGLLLTVWQCLRSRGLARRHVAP